MVRVRRDGPEVRVLGQDRAWDGYLKVFTRDELTVFQFDLTKHADRLADRVQGFVGTLLCDAESRNGAVSTEERPLAFCNATNKLGRGLPTPAPPW